MSAEHEMDRGQTFGTALEPASVPEASSVGLWASLAVLFRRWPVVLCGLLLTGLAMFGIFRAVPVTYSATGSLLLQVPEAVPSTSPGSTIPQNPILGTRSFVGDLLTTVMADPDVETRVLARGGTGTFKTTLGLGDAALVKIDTTGHTPEEAMATWTATADEASAALLRLQQDKHASADQMATISPITAPVSAKKEAGSRTRALAATMILGLGFTLALAYGAESLSQYRRSRRRLRSERKAGAGNGVEGAEGVSSRGLTLHSERSTGASSSSPAASSGEVGPEPRGPTAAPAADVN